MRSFVRSAVACSGLALLLPAVASTQQLITNGGFEIGLSGWTTFFAAGSSPPAGRYYLGSGTSSPVSGNPTPGANSGTGYAVSDMTGPGAGALFQTFTIGGPISSATLSFWMFVNNVAGVTLGAQDDFDFTTGPNQHGQVDLLSGSIVGNELGGTPLVNLYSGGATIGWVNIVFDITNFLTPGTYTLRFAEVDNQSFFLQGVDDVSLAVVSAVPEPATMTLIGLGLVGLSAASMVRRRRRRD